MQATVKPWLYTTKGKKSNGKFPVKLRLIFKREFKFYLTGIDMDENEFRSYHLNKKLKDLFSDITYYQNKAEKIASELKDGFTFKAFKEQFYGTIGSSNEAKKDDNFWNFGKAHVQKLRDQNRIKTAESIEQSNNKILKFCKKKKLLFSDITLEFLKKFDAAMRSESLSSTTIGIYTRNLRTLYNEAIRTEVISQESYPFGKNKYSPPTSKKTKKALKVEDIGKIFSYTPVSDIESWARDMWLFAYLGNGLNVKDIAQLKYEDIKQGEIHFLRAKTINTVQDNRPIQIIITDELQKIIDRWGKKTQRGGTYIFDLIKNEHSNAEQVAKDIHQAIKTINKYMGRIADNLELERKVTTNFARHSYATVLKRAGIPIEMISEQLGHTSVKTTEIYLDSFEKEQRMELSKHLTAFNIKENE